VVVVIGVGWGKAAHLRPLFQRKSSGSVLPGILAVLITTPFFLSGFSTVAQVMEEKAKRTSLKTVGWMIVLSIVAAAVFYCLIILACSMTIPWPQLVKLNLPAATAFNVAFHSRLLMRSVLVVALLGNFTVLNGVFLSASRVVFALGRAHIISSRFGTVLPATGTPAIAVLFVAGLGCLGIFLGQGALLPMVNITSSCIAFCYVLVCLGVIQMRRQRAGHSPYEVPGGIPTAALGALASLGILFIALYQPYADAGRSFPLEWSLIVLWSVLGAAFWFAGQKIRGTVSSAERRRIVLGAEVAAE
jgi:basic amino acid/polyamine antiporter, APA family